MVRSHATTILAYDRENRFYNDDGNLHVSITPISKANICEYMGKDIPNAQDLGLNPNKMYSLFRDDQELAKAAPTSNNMQLLMLHPDPNKDGNLNAENPLPHKVIGSTGTDGSFEMPYLKNSLVVWNKQAIDLIESNKVKELSCAYRYDADMTPGVYLGAPYDGVMRNIRFNHVALVPAGRAGIDVMVADARPVYAFDSMPLNYVQKSGVMTPMAKKTTATSARALVARGAMAAFLGPRLAMDAKVDLKQINFSESVQSIIDQITTVTNGHLAKGQNLDGLKFALDAAEEEIEEDAEVETEEEKKKREEKAREVADKKARDEEKTEAEKEKEEKEKEASDRKAARDAARAKDAKARDDETEEERKERENREKLEKEASDKKAKDMLEPKPITKQAMDAAIDLAVDAAVQAAVKLTEKRMLEKQHALREAEDLVRPVLGTLVAMDSAQSVYEQLFKSEGTDYKGVEPASYRALAKVVVEGATFKKQTRPASHMAMDSASVGSFASRFPHASKVVITH